MLLALVFLLAAPAEGLRLDWQAPAGCPDADVVRERVTAMVGPQADAAALQASAVVRAEGGRWVLELELVRAGSSERRTLVDGECRALAEAAALVIAVAIDPLARAPAEPGADEPAGAVVPLPPGPVIEPGPVAVPEDRPVVAVPEDRPVAAVPEDRPVVVVPEDRPVVAVPGDRSPRLRIGLRAGVGLGFLRVLPGVHAALDLGLGLEGRGWRVELAGVFAPAVRGTAAADPTIGGAFRLGAGELRGCGVPALRRAPLSFPLCAGLQIGAMHGQGLGDGLMLKLEARALWVALRPGVALRWRPRGGRVALWLGLDAIVALVRPRFESEGGVPVHRAAGLGGQATLGVEVRLR